jgi:hypothetical protein
MISTEATLGDVHVDGRGTTMRGTLDIPGVAPRELWVSLRDLTVPTDCVDALVLAALIPAMVHGATLRVRGAVTPRLLASLYEWQLVWSAWRPGLYHPIRIEPESLASAADRQEAVLAAFTGGVDSLYTVLHDQTSGRPRDREAITGAVFVHGQDIALSDRTAFEASAVRVARLADLLGIGFHVAATNVRDVLPSIEDGHGVLLAAALTAASDHAGTAVLAASHSYEENIFDWGSNPVSDPFLSSGRLLVVHDSAKADRLRKMEYIHRTRPELIQHLLFCPHRRNTGENCGTCEKCTRNWLTMRVAGIDEPRCFASPPSMSGIPRVLPRLRPYYQMLATAAHGYGRIQVERDIRGLLRRRPSISAVIRRSAARTPGLKSRHDHGRRYLGK